MMNDRLESGLKRFWMLASAVSLAFPYALSSMELASASYVRATEIAVICLFVVTLPSSFFAIPLLALFKLILEIDMSSMFGAYLYIILLNIIGYVQYFRLIPTFRGKAKPLKFDSILSE
jgi:hypothetical protein